MKRLTRRDRWALGILGAVAVGLVVFFLVGRIVERVPWVLEGIGEEERSLTLRYPIPGGSQCGGLERVEVEETEDAVRVAVFVWQYGYRGCPDVLGISTVEVSLEEALGDRALLGCELPERPEAQLDQLCRDTGRDPF